MCFILLDASQNFGERDFKLTPLRRPNWPRPATVILNGPRPAGSTPRAKPSEGSDPAPAKPHEAPIGSFSHIGASRTPQSAAVASS